MAMQALTVVNDSPIAQRDLDTYRKHYAPQSSPEEWELFIETCQAYGLSPKRKQIYLVSRPTWNARERREEWKATPQVSIEGLRDIAARTNKYQGRVGPFWKSKNGEWTDCWNIDNGTHPYAAKVGVWKDGFREPLFAVVYFHEMAQYAGKGENRRLNNFWDKFGIIMLAKCAEAASIRAAFPETSGLYIHEEMRQANAEAAYIRVTPEADDQDALAITGEVVQAIAETKSQQHDSTSNQPSERSSRQNASRTHQDGQERASHSGTSTIQATQHKPSLAQVASGSTHSSDEIDPITARAYALYDLAVEKNQIEKHEDGTRDKEALLKFCTSVLKVNITSLKHLTPSRFNSIEKYLQSVGNVEVAQAS